MNISGKFLSICDRIGNKQLHLKLQSNIPKFQKYQYKIYTITIDSEVELEKIGDKRKHLRQRFTYNAMVETIMSTKM